ncbi:MAG: hypothetical protein J0H74_01960 [Chitinophagaceae bacterium]|nr:hypothetical protein [Chitinophagaceae bacterium]
MENAYRTKEKALFYNVDSCSYAASAVPGGYPTDNTTIPNDSVARVNGSIHPMGPALLLKVMSGDSLTIATKAFFRSGGSTSQQQSVVPNILATLAGGLAGMTGGSHGTLGQLNTSGSPVGLSVDRFINNYDATPSTTPKAYLNWMLLDDQFNYDSASSGARPVTTPDQLLSLTAPLMKIKKSGYLYIWVSNETKGWDVFFDNLSIRYFSSPMVEETHYYPFGLTMAGISDKALKSQYVENKYRYNKGSELQNKEFSDGSGLEMYETQLRELDPQLGRWWQIDSKPDYALSLYSAMQNNPILHNDPLGDTSAPYPSRVNQPKFDPLTPLGVGPNKSQEEEKSKSTNEGTSPQTKKNKSSGSGEEPLIGSTTTQKVIKEKDIVRTPLLDKITVSGFSGKVEGKEGKIATTDVSYSNGKFDGASISAGPLTLGVNRDLSIQAGLGVDGYEGHLTVGLGVGFGQVGGGGSHKREDGTISGGDLTIRPGVGTVLVTAAAIVLVPLALAL